jgi:hypothetical protein
MDFGQIEIGAFGLAFRWLKEPRPTATKFPRAEGGL